MTLLIEKPLALPVVEPITPDVIPETQVVTGAAIPPVIARVPPKTSEQLQHELREGAHQVGFTAIAGMLRKEDDDTWH